MRTSRQDSMSRGPLFLAIHLGQIIALRRKLDFIWGSYV